MTTLSTVSAIGLLSARPAPGIGGRKYFATDTNQEWYDTGTSWVNISPLGSSVITVAFSTAPVFTCSPGICTFEMTLIGNVVSATLSNLSPGQIIIFAITQDRVGGHTFVWPTVVNNATLINPVASSRTVQPFYVGANGNLYPLSGGTYN